MSRRVRVPLPVPLRALRVHVPPPSAGLPAGDPRAAELLELRELAELRARRHQDLGALVTELRRVLGLLPGLVRDNLAEVAGLATEIGLAVAREVVGDALDRGTVDPAPVVRRCLEDAVAGLDEPRAAVHVHPDDLALVVAHLEAMPDLQGGIEGADFRPDSGVARGAVRVHTAAGSLLYDHREVLARLADELRRSMAAAAPLAENGA